VFWKKPSRVLVALPAARRGPPPLSLGATKNVLTARRWPGQEHTVRAAGHSVGLTTPEYSDGNAVLELATAGDDGTRSTGSTRSRSQDAAAGGLGREQGWSGLTLGADGCYTAIFAGERQVQITAMRQGPERFKRVENRFAQSSFAPIA